MGQTRNLSPERELETTAYIQWWNAEIEAIAQERDFCFWSPYVRLVSIHQLPRCHSPKE